jgi:hypothetical protein
MNFPNYFIKYKVLNLTIGSYQIYVFLLCPGNFTKSYEFKLLFHFYIILNLQFIIEL